MRLTCLTLNAKRRNAYGEYVIRCYGSDGIRYPDADYFTNDRDDAINTLHAMVADTKYLNGSIVDNGIRNQ